MVSTGLQSSTAPADSFIKTRSQSDSLKLCIVRMSRAGAAFLAFRGGNSTWVVPRDPLPGTLVHVVSRVKWTLAAWIVTEL